MADTAPVASADAERLPGRHDHAMNGSSHRGPTDEERALFERLVELRRRYAAREADDAIPVVGLHHAITSANAAMSDVPTERVHLGISGN